MTKRFYVLMRDATDRRGADYVEAVAMDLFLHLTPYGAAAKRFRTCGQALAFKRYWKLAKNWRAVPMSV